MFSSFTAPGLLAAILSTSATADIAASTPPASLRCEQTDVRSCDSAGRCEAALETTAPTKFYLILRLADSSYRWEMRSADGGTVGEDAGRITLLNGYEEAADPLGFRILLGQGAVVTLFRTGDDADRLEGVLQKAVANRATMSWYSCTSRAAS